LFVENKTKSTIHLSSCRFAVGVCERNRLDYNTLDEVFAKRKKVIPCEVCLKDGDIRKEIDNKNKAKKK